MIKNILLMYYQVYGSIEYYYLGNLSNKGLNVPWNNNLKKKIERICKWFLISLSKASSIYKDISRESDG